MQYMAMKELLSVLVSVLKDQVKMKLPLKILHYSLYIIVAFTGTNLELQSFPPS